MKSSPNRLGRVAGATLAGAGALFIAVQINHPPLTLELVGTSEFLVRETCKVAMAALALAGIVALTVWHRHRIGPLAVVGASLLGLGYLAMLCVQTIAALVLPAIVRTSPGYVWGVLVAATGGQPASDIGAIQILLNASGVGYLLGGLVYGIALFRMGLVARWASALLSAGTTSTVASAVLPEFFDRVLAVPAGIALIGIGWSAWHGAAPAPVAQSESARLEGVAR